MSTLILPTPTIVEQEAEDFDPIPQIALALADIPVTPFKLALPDGAGAFVAWFNIEVELAITQAAVRYALPLPPTFLPFSKTLWAMAGDEIRVRLITGTQ